MTTTTKQLTKPTFVSCRGGYFGTGTELKNKPLPETNQEEPLLPAGVETPAVKQAISDDKLRHLQEAIEKDGGLLPTDFNASITSRKVKADDDDSNFLLPIIYK